MPKKKSNIYLFIAIASKLINAFLVLKILSIFLSNGDMERFLVVFSEMTVWQYIFTLGLLTGFVAEARGGMIYVDVLLLFLIGCAVLALMMLLNSSSLLIVVTSFLFSIKAVFFAIMNGQDDKKRFSIFCFIDSLVVVTTFLYLNKIYQGNGYVNVIYSYCVSSLIIIIGYFTIKIKEMYKQCLFYINSIEAFLIYIKEFSKKYKHYCVMSFFSAFVVPYIYYDVKNFISLYEVGDVAWRASLLSAWRLYDSFLMVVGTVSSIYYIPLFSKSSSNFLVLKHALIAFQVALLLPIVTFFFPSNIIGLLLSSSFVDNSSVFVIIFLSLSIRVFSYICGLKLVVAKRSINFILVEIAHIFIFLSSCYFFFYINKSYMIYSFLAQAIVSVIITLWFMKNEN
ncbi:TPA: hypothetical protein ACSP27_002841 [Aeromonas veronii]